eukprot:m.77202 g.77202  ORF g.77202 m.77202 type:complete len:145 (-) comp19095_c0_seq1:155-589(-)
MASSAFVANMEQPLMVCVAPEDCEFFYEYFWRQRLEDSEGKASKKPKSSHFPFKVDLSRQLTAEFVGTAWLVATVVGSGIGGDRVSSDDGVALLGNTLATLGCLYVLITIFVKVSEKNGACACMAPPHCTHCTKTCSSLPVSKS